MYKRLLKTLAGHTGHGIPFWFMRQAGRYLPEYRALREKAGSFLAMCYNPALAEEITLQPIRRFHPDAAILFSDILVVPHALGMDLRFETGEGPLLKPVEKLSELSLKGIETHLQPVYETVSRLSSSLPKDVTLIGFAGSPWTVASYMVEGKGSKTFDVIRYKTYSDPVFFQQLIDILVEATSQYLCLQINAGAEVVQLFDSWSGVVSADQFDQWVIAPTKKIVENVKAQYPHIPIIGFPRAAGVQYRRYAEQTGVSAIGTDYMLPIDYIKELQSIVPVQGNLDPLLLAANKEKTVEQAKILLDTLGNKPFIFNLGHGMVPHTPIENVEALAKTIREWK